MALRYLKQDRSLALRGSILLTDGTTHALSADNVVRYHIDETSTGGDAITIGDTRAAEYRLEIEDTAHSLTAAQLLGATVTMEIGLDGTYDPLGVWTVSRTRISRQSATVDLSGADALSDKADGLYVDGTYPTTLGQIAQRAANQAGLTLKSASFRNSGVSVSSTPEWNKDTNSIRAVIGYVAGCAGGFARIDRAGKLEIVPYNTLTAGEVSADYFSTLNVGMGRSMSLNCLQVMHYNTNVYTRYAIDASAEDTAGNTLRISDNPLMTDAIAKALLTALAGMTGQAISADWVGDPTVTTGAVLTYVDTDGKRYPGIVTGQTIEIDGGLHMTTDADLPESISASYATDTLYTPSGRVNIAAIEGRIKVWAQDEISLQVGESAEELRTEINADIEGITTRVASAEGNISTLQQTTSGLSTRVSSAEGNISTLQQTTSGLSARVASAEGDISTLEQTATSLNSKIESTASGLQSQINQTPGLIGAAVGDIQIGGTNLLRETGWYTDVADTSVGWLYTSGAYIEYPYDTYPGTDDFGDNGYIHWTGEKTGDLNTPKVSTRAGEIYTVSFRHRGAGLTLYIVGLNAAGTQTWGPSKLYGNPATTDCAYTFAIPSDRDVSSIYAVFRSSVGEAGVLGRIKLERGNKATSWSPHPMDNARGVVNGSAIRITPEGIYATTPELGINVAGTKGDMSISERGLAIDQINSPSVRARYQGPGVITVGQYQVAPNGESVFATLSDAFAKINDKHLPYPVTINFASDTYEQDTRLENVSGEPITINGNNCKHMGEIVLRGVVSEVTINNLYITDVWAANIARIENCARIIFAACTVIGGYSQGHNGQLGVHAVTSSIGMDNCILSDIYHAIWINDNGQGYISSCSGNNNYYSIVLRKNSRVGILGSRPPGTNSADASSNILNNKDPVDSGTAAQPETVSSVTLTATNTRTHDGGGWYSGTNVLSQGVRSGTTFRGYMWFDLSAISGKTIKAAAIRLYRRAGVGSGNPVKVLVGAHNASGPSGPMNLISGFNDLIVGMVDQKEVLKASIATEAAQHLANGTATGLYIHSDSTGYAQFDGYDGAYAPQLYVTYV